MQALKLCSTNTQIKLKVRQALKQAGPQLSSTVLVSTQKKLQARQSASSCAAQCWSAPKDGGPSAVQYSTGQRPEDNRNQAHPPAVQRSAGLQHLW